MSYEGVQLVIGLALIDSTFREALFSDRRRAILGLPLTEEEAALLLETSAQTLAELAQELDLWIENRTDSRPQRREENQVRLTSVDQGRRGAP